MASANRAENLSELRIAADHEANHFTLPEGWEDDREKVYGLTIDGPKTLDRDDAIALSLLEKPDDGRYLASISIADVASFLDQQSTPAIEAYARHMGETRYLARGKRRMIPQRISEYMLSILHSREKTETPVLTASIVIEADGSTGPMAFSRERMRPRALTYDEVARLRNGDGTTEYTDMMRAYEKVARILYARRTRNGQLVDEDLNAETEHPGELIVREFMILANTAVAKFMAENGIPGLYRVHEGIVASYSTVASGHQGLGLTEPYTHFTSPLRRFADFVNHTNIVAFLEGRDFVYQGDELEAIAQHLNDVRDEQRQIRLKRQRAVASEALYATRMAAMPPPTELAVAA